MKPCHLPALKSLAPLGVMVTTLLCSPSLLSAQTGGAPGVATLTPPREERPLGGTGEVAIKKELLTILQNWELAGKHTKNLEGKHRRYIYDNVFFVHKWSEGEFYYEAPDKGRIDLEAPKNFKEGTKVNGQGKWAGKTFEVKKDKPERWICDGTQLVAIDEDRREYQRIPIPPESRGRNIENGPLPFLFGITVEKIVARYHVTLNDDAAQGGQHDLGRNRIHLKVKPLWSSDAANWQEAEVMLTADTYLPQAIRLIHPGGNSETVYVFYDVKRNASRGVFSLWKGSPFEPRLTGYKELTTTAMEATERK